MKDSVPDFALDLYPNKALLFDPRKIGSILWPNRATLPAEINLELTNFFFELIADESLRPVNQVLRALYAMTGVMSFNLSFYNLARHAEGLEGFYVDPSKPFITVEAKKDKPANFKDKIAVYGQMILLRLVPKPNLTISRNTIYDEARFGRIYRLRRAERVPAVLKSKLNDKEEKGVQEIAQRVEDKVLEIAERHQIEVDPKTLGHYREYIRSEIAKAYGDLKSYQRFFGKSEFQFFERSLTPYHKALIAIVCNENGEDANSTYHGVCQTASEPDVATMANSSVFWGVTQAFTDDAQELSNKLPEKLRTYEISNMGQEQHYKAFIKKDHNREKIKRVAIMGRHMVMRYSAFNSLEFPAYLDIERKVSDLLLREGYEVVYKAHPECEWRHFDKFFDPRVSVDWRPFEPVMNEFDAVFYHFGASSTVPHVLGSHLHVFMLQDGWHDVKIWPSRIQKFYREYCNMLPARIDEQSGLIVLDEAAALHAFENPVKFDKEQRVRDFFCKRY